MVPLPHRPSKRAHVAHHIMQIMLSWALGLAKLANCVSKEELMSSVVEELARLEVALIDIIQSLDEMSAPAGIAAHLDLGLARLREFAEIRRAWANGDNASDNK